MNRASPPPRETDWPDDAGEVWGELMEFHLAYRGRLPAGGSPTVKDQIRKDISRQLWELQRIDRRIRPELDQGFLADVKAGRVVPAESDNPSGLPLIILRQRIFCPLVDRRRSLVCHLAINFLRRDEPGGIVHGGDLDNRIKTLFDALRIPHAESEVPENPDYEARVYDGSAIRETTLCLLEDDSLITKLTIDTGPLLDPAREDEYRHDVRLEIAVTIKAARGGSGHWMAK